MERKKLHLMETAQFDHGMTARARVEQLLRNDVPICLFLDIDGTLLDMALTPSAVRVPPELADILGGVAARFSGALAIVTGRPIAEADALLKPATLVAAGVHGAEMRTSVTGEIISQISGFGPDLLDDIRTAANAMPGVVAENKGAGIALHYRLAPDLRAPLLASLDALVEKYPGQFSICEGRKVVELLPVGFSKGHALRTLASLPEFSGRRPVMIGDDIADIGAFRAAKELDGYGLKVAGEIFSHEEAAFTAPADVLAWLKALTGTA
jgi:trehalose 6-phosphate phosphatase